MGKFKNQNLKFKTDEAVIFGSGDEASIGYDGTDLTVDVPILGSAPTKDDHLATKKSVDDADTAVSGAIDEKLAGKANSAHDHTVVKYDDINKVEITHEGGGGPTIDKVEIKQNDVVVGKWENGALSLTGGQSVYEFTSTMGNHSQKVPTEWAVSNALSTVSGDITSYGDETYADTVHTHDKIVENYADPYYNAVITVHSGGGMDPLNRYILFVQDSVEVGKFKDGRLFLANGYGSNQGVDTISYDFSGRIGDLGNAFKTLPTEYAVLNYVDTISGAIIAQIPSLSGYATDAEVSTISGDIIAQIPSVVDFVTDAEITVISGDIIAQIPTDYISDAEMTTISGDIVAQIGEGGGVTEEQLTTTSGDIVDQIPSLSGYLQNVSEDTSPDLGGNLGFGAYTISGTGVIVTGDHGTATLPQVVNVVYGTGSAPTISGTNITEGTLYIKYTA